MFDSIPANADRKLVKELFWFSVDNELTKDGYERCKYFYAGLDGTLYQNQLVHDYVKTVVIPTYQQYCASSDFIVHDLDRIVLESLIKECLENPEKFGL